ncbi:MAG: ribosome biogenesis GTPase Der [Proteobacteria bacterium]|jgi:GTPase|nr:ribosome biogenesis GTPase Der [Pseudomonadota bacterium]
MRPLIALIGRPNVGKSTLFNFLTRSRDALVADFPGLTRDRKYGFCDRYERSCVVVDTGGIADQENELDEGMQAQTDLAIEEAAIVLLLVDSKQGLVPEDLNIIADLRKKSINFYLVVNKIDSENAATAASDFYQISADEVFPIAARTGRGVQPLLEALLPEASEEDLLPMTDSGATRIAVIGRPNAGKSTLINALLREDRLITSAIPGTTRDSVTIPFEFDNHQYELIDTAGVRRRVKVKETVEKFSIVQTLSSVASAHVVICVVDLLEGLADQDSTLLEIALREGRACVLAINKTDSASKDDYTVLDYTVDTKYRYLTYVQKINISAKKKIGLKKLMHAVMLANKSAALDVTTSELNKVLERAVIANPPPMIHGRRIKLRYMHQGGSYPPTFVLFGNQTNKLPPTYLRYLENHFRKSFKLVGTPVRFLLRNSENPFAGKRNILTARQLKKRERIMKHKRR